MKKLRLNSLEFKQSEMLSREQLKKIIGGSGSGNNEGCSATAACLDGSTTTVSCPFVDSMCTSVDASGTHNGYAYCQGGAGGTIYYAVC